MAFNPFFFNDSPLPMELIYKALEELKYLSPTVEEVKVKLDKLIKDLDGEIKEEVSKVIEEMYNSGELARVIGSILTQSLNGKAGDIDLQYMGRVIRTAHNFKNFSTSNHEDDWATLHYNYAQGNVVFDKDNNRYWAVAYVCNNGSVYKYNNACELVIYKLNRATGGFEYLTSFTYADVGHCNALGYNDGYIYITPNSYQRSDSQSASGYRGVPSRDVLRIAFNNETLADETDGITLTDVPRLIGYDSLGNERLNFVDGICFDNDGIGYVFDGLGDVYTFNWNDASAVLVFDNIKGNNSAPGGMQIDDNFIYLMEFAQYKINRYNKTLGRIDWSYNLPIKANCRTYKTGEIEGITLIDGDIYICSAYDLAMLACCYTMIRFFRQSLGNNNYPPVNIYGWSSLYNTTFQTFFVAGDYPNDYDDITILSGFRTKIDNSTYDYSNSFRCLHEAIDYIDGSEWIKRAQINVMQAQHCAPVEVITTKPIVISGDKNNPPLIGCLMARDCPFIQVQNIGIRNRVPTLNAPTSVVTNNCFWLSGGNITLINPYMPVGNISNSVNVVNGMYIENATCNIAIAADFIGTRVPHDWESLRTAQGVNNPEFIHATQCTINSHGMYGSQADPLTSNIIA